jgi:spore germination protein YaaH
MRFSFIGTVAGLLLVLAATPALASARSLESGMKGADVTELQQGLVTKGYLKATPTGYFGPATLTALKKFQCDKDIACSGDGWGVYGPTTRSALQIALAPKQPATNVGGKLTAKATGKFEISGWVPDWRAASGTADVTPHLDMFASVMPFGFTMSADGHVLDNAHLDREPWLTFIANAKAKKVRVVPSIMWGYGPEIQEVLSDPVRRNALADEIVALVKKRGYDGIDIDFEAKQSQTINYFSAFLKTLYARMGNKWVYCTIEARMPLEDRYLPNMTIPPDATEYANDFYVLNKYCDRVEIMAYDQGLVDSRLNVARTAPYAPVADPGWVENIARLAAQTISRNKLILGIPAYGYEYSVTARGNGTYQYKSLGAFNPTYGWKLANQLGVVPSRTSANELGFVYNTNSTMAVGPGFSAPALADNATPIQNPNQAPTTSVTQNLAAQSAALQQFNFVTWSDAQAIGDKVKLAHDLGLRGVAIFSLGGAEDQGIWNVLK